MILNFLLYHLKTAFLVPDCFHFPLLSYSAYRETIESCTRD